MKFNDRPEELDRMSSARRRNPVKLLTY